MSGTKTKVLVVHEHLNVPIKDAEGNIVTRLEFQRGDVISQQDQVEIVLNDLHLRQRVTPTFHDLSTLEVQPEVIDTKAE